ncbi:MULTISPECIES: hypothetical protein [unclassified Coleofasciculus]|uniref:hypothetical protein n=1 Tax=unclassified Coleofasciculus TaxID=2692782 RepID=UPI001881FF1C|nr:MULTISPECIES: hypothetical protein [unclassified Coleofasciculus]MBE9128205.1 hypothetical protein [Coleofasciculus sp. LEGE 07081]MBE9150953.1 hypothetical protein [Coleofasciculus sp. LEGE 07092]
MSKKQRLQIDIKPNHQGRIRELMEKLGGVSAADAVGFLVETQMNYAMARLQPEFQLQYSASIQNSCQSTHQQSQAIPAKKQNLISNRSESNDAADALSMLMNS